VAGPSPDRVISLTEALRHLTKVEASLRPNDRNPFFFIAGSGISTPSVPTAESIVAHCRKELGNPPEIKFTSPSERYSYWFSQAYPQPIDRQRYLAALIKAARVTPAILALAHLLIEGRLARLVVTPNFDDLIVRALNLFGAGPLVSDHPYTVGRVDPESDDIQVVHVHGSYHFYDLANLSAEIYDRRTTKIGAPVAIPELLERVLWDRSPIVVGYSGWPDDVIMVTLERRLRSALNRNLYWFCFDSREIETFPEWLKNNNNVYFVIGDPGARIVISASEKQITDTDDAPGPQRDGKEIEPTRLPADRFFNDLIAALKLPAPALTVSPIAFFYRQVASAVQGSISGGPSRDNYYFSEVLQRIDRARGFEEQRVRGDEGFEQLLDAARRSAFPEIAAIASRVAPEITVISQLREIASILESALQSTQTSTGVRSDLLNALDVALGRIAIEDGSREDQRIWVSRRLALAGELQMLGRSSDANRIYDEVIEGHADDVDGRLRADSIRAQQYKADAIAIAGDLERALYLMDETHKRYKVDGNGAVKDAVAELEFKRAVIARRKGDDVGAALDAIIKQYRKATSTIQRRICAQAMELRANITYLDRNNENRLQDEIRLRLEIDAFTEGKPTLRSERIGNLIDLVASYSLNDEYEKSIETANKALSELSGHDAIEDAVSRAQVLRWRASAESGKKDYAAAERTLRKLIELEPLESSAILEVVHFAYRRLLQILKLQGLNDNAEALIREVETRANDSSRGVNFRELAASLRASEIDIKGKHKSSRRSKKTVE
jgi:tetratricopeptide (TPR) repeat protein